MMLKVLGRSRLGERVKELKPLIRFGYIANLNISILYF